MPQPGKPHRARQHGGHRPASATTCTRRPAAWHTARAARVAPAASMHSAASRRSTGMPSAMLAATSSTCRSPSEHGRTPCTASAAAAKSIAATWRSRNGSHRTSTATCRKSSRSSQARCEISSSAAASVGSHPFAHARIASARSSKHVVRRGVLRLRSAFPAAESGRSPHQRAVGPAVHLAVAESADADARRDYSAEGEGNPQGSPISPLLANLFMHYAFDRWMDREFPGCPFERYADDIVAHCDTGDQARQLRAAIAERLGTLGLELHPVKTKIVYCKDANRRGDFGHASFDFLGYTFRGRLAQGPRGYFTGFNPAISGKAKKAKGKQIRDWHLNRRSSADLSSLADQINPQVRGWINYYGAFYRSGLRFLAWRINEHLARWAMQKFKRFRGKYAKAMAWLQKVYQYKPDLFAHWQLIAFTASRTVGAG